MNQLKQIPKEFNEKAEFQSWLYVVSNLLFILLAGVISYKINHWLVYSLTFIVVAARIQSLYILQHECMHWLLFKSRKTNDIVGVIISGFIGTKLYEGRTYHFKHHKDVGLASDPNEFYHNLNDRNSFFKKLSFFGLQLFGLRLFQFGLNIIGIKLGSHASNIDPIEKEEARKDFFALIIVQLIVIGIITLLSNFWVYIFLFFLPTVTLTCFFEAIRSFSEHTLPGEIPRNEVENKRVFYMKSNFYETFFISQFHFNYHHLHHLYPFVVTFKLKKLHAWLLKNDEDYASRFITRRSYTSVLLKFLFNSKFEGAGKHYPK